MSDNFLDFDTLAKDNIRTLKLPMQSYQKPLCVIMVGYPTSGKTTLAKKLQSVFPFTYFSEEDLTSFLSPRATVTSRNATQVFQLALKTIEHLILMKKACIYDACVKTKQQRDLIRNTVEKSQGRYLLLYLKCSREVCLSRLEKHNLEVSRGEKKGFIYDQDTFDYEISTTSLPSNLEHPVEAKCDSIEADIPIRSIIDSTLKSDH